MFESGSGTEQCVKWGSRLPVALAVLACGFLAALAVPGVASALPPVVTTNAATEIGKDTATVNGLVNPTSLPTTYWFEYGTSKEYGSKTAELSAGSGSSSVPVSAGLSGLSPSTTYHFRLVAKNFSGTTKGGDETFTTQSAVVTTEAATDVFSKDAVLNGSINPQGQAASFYFEYGTSLAYGSQTPEESAGAGSEAVKKSAALESLTPGTTYHFRIVRVNGEGTTPGGDRTFRTPERSWFLQSSPNGESYSGLESVSCVSSSECLAVGDIWPLAATSWNGTEWSLSTMVEPESGGEIDDVSCSAFNACTAVGHSGEQTNASTLVERWNGSEWKIQESPNPAGAESSHLHGVSCASSTSCLAVGAYLDAESNWHAFSEIWNGSEWKVQTMPSPGGKPGSEVIDISCTSSTACTAVGTSSSGTLAERWNGSEWKIQTTPAGGWVLEAVSCASASFCLAVGSTPPAEYKAYATSWNGTEWKALAAPTPPGAVVAELLGVSCPSTTVCEAVGWFEDEPESGRPLAESWIEGKWEIQPPRLPNGEEQSGFSDVSCPSTSICEGVGVWSEGGSGYTLAERYE